jgi:oligoribonuclease NrnB/cAMP/cGMP phosphodiesterase (DHH superfamily)
MAYSNEMLAAMSSDKRILVIYHKHCNDGFAAAYILWHEFKDEAEYLPMSYNEELPLVAYRNKDVYIVDFSFPPAIHVEIAQHANYLVWLDHHKTAIQAFRPSTTVSYLYRDPKCFIDLDMSQSGAGLAAKHFDDCVKSNPIIQKMVMHVEDYDLWRFTYPDTKAFNAWLNLMPKEFKLWDMLFHKDLTEYEWESYIEKGKLLLRAREFQIEELSKKARAVTLLEQLGSAVNAPSMFASELGNKLAERSGTFGMVWECTPDGTIKVSLRSVDLYDVSTLAKQFGGGGHRNAAGFYTSYKALAQILSL